MVDFLKNLVNNTLNKEEIFMKLRITEDHIRFRITQNEFLKLSEKQTLSASLLLPANHIFSYQISPVTDNQLKLGFVDNTITLLVPIRILSKLINSINGESNYYIAHDKKIKFSIEVDIKEKNK